VLLHGASTLAATPTTLKLSVCPQAHAAAVPLGAALVEVHCGVQWTRNITYFSKV